MKILFAFLLAGALPALSGPATLQQGWDYLNQEKFEEAWKIGSTLIKLDENNVEFMVFLATTEIERKNYAQALEWTHSALKVSPGDRDASMVQARALFLLERKGEAMAILEKLIKKYPNYTQVIYRKAVFLLEMGKNEEALGYFEKLAQSDPANSAYRRARAKALQGAGLTEEAKTEWKKLVRKEPDAESLLNLGWIYWDEKNITEAWEIGSTLLKIDDNNPAFLRFMTNMEIEKGDYAQALKLAQRAESLSPEDKDIQILTAKASLLLGRQDEAGDILEKLIQKYPNDKSILHQWALYLARCGKFEDALLSLDRLLQSDPGHYGYRLQHADMLYEIRRFEGALAEWKMLAAREGAGIEPLLRLRDDAFNRQSWSEALLWQQKLMARMPSDPAALEKLSKIYTAMGRHSKAFKAAEKAMEYDPLSISAHFLKAEALEQWGNWPEAEKAYRQISQRNPNSSRALNGLSYALEAQKKYDEALEVLKKIEKMLLPSYSPHLDIRRARLLADSGKTAQAMDLLRRLTKKRQKIIPAILYHGISDSDREEAIPAENLRSHLEALQKRGFQSITTAELNAHFQGRGRLPKKPILITFDDGRKDSFEYADPILKALKFKAVMFMHLTELRKPNFHASAEEIRKWRATGRWDIQAHGYHAHDPMPLDNFAKAGHFLANRRWLDQEYRIETMEEYRVRIDGEYRRAKEKLEQMLPGADIIAFAYPYGDFGHADYTNTPESALINQELVKKYFKLAFAQEQDGFNAIYSNPTYLKRFEVPRHIGAQELLRYLEFNDPWVQAKIMEMELWRQSDQMGRAQAVYTELAKSGYRGLGWQPRGVIFPKYGQSAKTPNAYASTKIQDFSDNYSSNVSKTMLRSGFTSGAVRLEGWAGRASYSDLLDRQGASSLSTISAQEAGGEIRAFISPRLELHPSYTRRIFSQARPGNVQSYSASLAYQLRPQWKIGIRSGAGNVETASAIRAGRDYHFAGADALWDLAINWQAALSYDFIRYNDANRENGAKLQISKRVSRSFSMGASVSKADSARRSNEYYTPQDLSQYMGTISFQHPIGSRSARTHLSRADISLELNQGWAHQPNNSRSVQSFKGRLVWRIVDFVALTAETQHSQSPTYRSRRFDGGISLSY